ncbi:hypothetical protein MTR_1g035440 [Medicago truncatula]|uniref:TF-B3 domain-containing protein n=1 Tax=Medicago truncatula TaxID=3880 RepID=A0A072VRP8_MEDTR|nr:hypothetical protein MTR_1g035440 [Medicago truncatula]
MSCQELNHRNIGVHFFKIILQTNLQEGKLKVPISFVKRHWQRVTNPVTLRLPNTTEKKVFWKKTSHHVVRFCGGWKEFTDYLSLRDLQLLMFQYQENSLFNVIVLGKCGLEIKYPLKETTEEYEEVEKSDNSLKIIKDPSSRRGKRPKSSSPSSGVSKKMKNNPEEQKESKHEKRKVQAHARFHNFKDVDNGWCCYFIFVFLGELLNFLAGTSCSCDDLKERSQVLYDKVKNKFHSDKNFFVCDPNDIH